MDIKKLFFVLLILSLIFSISAVSALENNTLENTESNELEVTGRDILENTFEDNNQLSNEETCIIYINQNTTSDGGDGSKDNPYNTLQLACDNISGENNVEININEGTYYIESDLKFNASNLFIKGNGKVILTNLNDNPGYKGSLGLTSPSANFTFTNIIFDASNFNLHGSQSSNKAVFNIINGKANLGVFNNCTFINFNDARICSSPSFNKKFNYCSFLGNYNHLGYYSVLDSPPFEMEFNYCTISSNINLGTTQHSIHTNITFNNVWFGQNSLANYIKYTGVRDDLVFVQNCYFPVNNHAIFSTYEKYIGDDTFEIMGQLAWDDGSLENIDKLDHLTVYLSSKTGNLTKNNVTLENGYFKVIYKSNSIDNMVNVVLDREDIDLKFTKDIGVSAIPIIYGDDQNVTVKLPKSVNSIVYISVNNKTYEVNVNDSNVFNFTIPDELLADIYQIDIKINDTFNHIYGVNSTQWTISKINKELLISTPIGTNIDDKQIILNVFLEDDAAGNITIVCKDKNMTQECNGGGVNINIAKILHAGDNNITVLYSGNKRYMNQIKSDIITVNGVYPNMNITQPSTPFIYDKQANITISLPVNATGNLTIIADNKNLTFNSIKNEMSVDISSLISVGENTVYISYSGDAWWDNQIQKINVVVNKITPVMAVNIIQKTVKVGENVTIKYNLPSNATGNISVKINDIVYNFTTSDKELTVLGLISGLNNITINYLGNNIYNPKSITANFTVDKWNISLNQSIITVNNHTTPTFIINLANDINGNALILINGKQYNIMLVNGEGSLKINDLAPDNYNALFKFNGDDKYNGFSKNLLFNVPKPILKASDMNILYTSGLKYTVKVTASGLPVVGKQVTFAVNGKKTILFTDDNGLASMKINLPPKSTKYTISTECQGVIIKNKIKVNGIIKAKNIKVKKSAKTLKIKVSLKKVDGKYLKAKKLTLKIKGKTYKAKTNKKGVATFKIKKNILKKLKKGKKYTYKVTYLKESVNKKIIVK